MLMRPLNPRLLSASFLSCMAAWMFAASPAFAQTKEPATLLQDFEGKVEVGHWPEAAHPEISTDWAADGKHSLKIRKGELASIQDMVTHDWSGYQVWRFHCHVPGKE